MKAILLAGGQGTRLKAVTGDLPKPLVPLLGRPLMEHILRLLKKHGFTQVCAALRYRPEDVMLRPGRRERAWRWSWNTGWRKRIWAPRGR